MARFILLAIFFFLSVSAMAQTDSTAIKLQQYKEWKEQGLIDEAEYDRLKKNLLNISSSVPEAKKIDPQTFKSKAKSQLIAGSIITTFGVAAIAGGVYKKRHPPSITRFRTYNGFDRNKYEEAVKKNTRQGRAFIAVGAIEMAIAGYFFYRAGHNFTLYRAASFNANVFVSPNGGTLTLNF